MAANRPLAQSAKYTTLKGSRSAPVLNRLVWVTVVIVAIGGVFTENALLIAACALTLPIIVNLLWLQVHSPILLFACGMHWLQVAMPVVYSSYLGQSVTETFRIAQIEFATYLSLLGIIVLALGIRLSWVGIPRERDNVVQLELRQLMLQRCFIAWLVALAIASAAGVVAWRIPGMSQLVYSINGIKWVMFFILAYGVLVQDRGYIYMLIAVGVEFVSGLAGYFASFKEVFLMLFLIALCTRLRLRQRGQLILASTFVMVVFTSLLWTAIKKPYRFFLNRGTGQQTVSVPIIDRFSKMRDLLLELRQEDLDRSVEELVLRVCYTEYFARAIAYVPRVVPFENGKLWYGAIAHVVQPRLLFPKKAALNDSARLIRYTGVQVAGADFGTSIGIGYMGESYIDFGPIGMFVPILLLGMAFGFVYRIFSFSNRSAVLGVAVATAVLFFVQQGFAASNVKLFGGLVTQCLVMATLNYLFGNRVMRWLNGRPRSFARS